MTLPIWRRILLWWLIQIILLPVYGPWLNGRFAIWQPDHDHIYLGKVKPGHPHTDQETNDIIFLPNKLLVGQILNFIIAPAKPVLPEYRDQPLSFAFHEQLLCHHSIFIPPLEKPPRV